MVKLDIDFYSSYVREYFRDYNEINALIRLGFSPIEALDALEHLSSNATVQNMIMDYKETFLGKVQADTGKYRSVLLEQFYKLATTGQRHNVKVELPGVLQLDVDSEEDLESKEITFIIEDARLEGAGTI